MSQKGLGFKPFSRRVVERLARGRLMGLGAYMYVAHRLTALLLTFYLFAHLYVLGSVLSGPNGFNQMMSMMGNPVLRLPELGLIWVVLFHAFNGLRLTALNLVPTLNQKVLAGVVVVGSFGITLISLPLFVGVL